MSLSKHLDLDLAWRRVKRNSRYDFIFSPWSYEVYGASLDENLQRLREKVDCGYHFSDVDVIEVPKPGFTLRPGAALAVDDRIVYQAMLDKIAPQIEEHLDEGVVFGHRLHPTPDSDYMFVFRPNPFNEFREDLLKKLKSLQFDALVVGDIAAYFENIDIGKLHQFLSGFGVDQKLLGELTKALRRWAGPRSRGIPQSMWPSSYLGNCFLQPLDKAMVLQGYAYSRFMDDIRIVCKTESQAKRALAELDRRLRDLGLNVQTAKTRIVRGDEAIQVAERIETRLEKKKDPRIAQLLENADPYTLEDITEEEIDELIGEELATVALHDLYRDALNKPRDHDTGDLPFCLKLFAQTQDRIAIRDVIDSLATRPHLSHVFARYLSVFASEDYIRNELRNFLSSPDNIYAWQEMWLLHVFCARGKVTLPERKLLWKIASDRNKHFACRQLAIMALGENGEASDLDQVKRLYSRNEPLAIRKAIILAVGKLPRASRAHFYNTHESDAPGIRQVIRYVKERVR